jgi:ADP-ribosyl-[dinitrogen reductase] hydrolase
MKNRYTTSLLGLACGDAVGTTVEFMHRGTFEPVTDMVGGGPFGLAPGEWTDDTSMALCLAESLLKTGGSDPKDQIERYVRWWREGYFSSTGECFDIGGTVHKALQRYLETGNPFSGPTHPRSAGNGSIMRLTPVPMYFAVDMEKVIHFAAESSRTTHGTAEAVDACKLFGVMIAMALDGNKKEAILFETDKYLDWNNLSPKIRESAAGEYQNKSGEEIVGSGYVVKSLEAALWVFHTTGSYEEAILSAVNLGNDADTTGVVVGQLAGAYYGAESIPGGWLEKLKYKDLIEKLAIRLYENRLTR